MRQLLARFAVLTSVALTAATLAAQFDPSAMPANGPKAQRAALVAERSADYQEFRREVGGTWVSQWCPATGTPMAIYGTGALIGDWREDSLAEASRHADWAVDHWASLFGEGDSTFVQVIGARMGSERQFHAYSFTYAQFYRGLPVIGGRVDVRVHRSGVFSWFGSRAWPIPKGLPTVPAIDEDNAAIRAAQELGVASDLRQLGGRKPRLVIWGDGDAGQLAPVFLAWEVPVAAVDGNGDGPIGRCYVDARSGAPLRYVSDKHECGFHHGGPEGHGDGAAPAVPPAVYTVQGWTRVGLSAVSPPSNIPLPGLRLSIPGLGTVTTDANGQFTADLSVATPVSLALQGMHSSTVSGSSAPVVLATLQPGVSATLQFLARNAIDAQLAHTDGYYWVYQANEWARSIVGDHAQMDSLDTMGVNVNLAQTCNAFFSTAFGPNIDFYAAGGGCNNSAFSTVITHEWGHGLDYAYGGISNVAGDGLSEGWADTVAMYLTDQPIIGLGFQTSGGFVRTGNNTTMYGTQTEVHAAGEVWMGFNWLFRQNLRAVLGDAQAVAISNTDVIGSIVANAQDQQTAVQQVFVADDDDGNLLNGTPHYDQLSAAAIAHGMPFPVRQLLAIASVPLAATNLELTPRTVVASVVPIIGSLLAVDLVYNDGAPHTRAMIPTGVPDQYQALLPGRRSLSVTTYHIEATHSSSAVIRLPATGEFSSVVFLNGAPALPAELTILPEQQQQGQPISLSIQTNGPLPFVLAIGDSAGPTTIPGVPDVLVGGNTFTFGAYTDAAGQFSGSFPAPVGVALSGFRWYAQVVTLDATGVLVVSNQFQNLFVQ